MSFSKLLNPTLTITTLLLMIFTVGQAAAEVEQAPTRDQIEDKYKWDLADFFPSDEAWEEAFTDLEGFFPGIEKYKGQLGSSPKVLVECLELSDSIGIAAHRLYVYANLKYDEDQSVGKYQELSTRTRMLYSQIGQSTSFIDPEILEIPDEKLKSFIKSGDLGVYDFYIEDLLRKKAHILSAEQEEILSLAGPLAAGPSKGSSCSAICPASVISVPRSKKAAAAVATMASVMTPPRMIESVVSVRLSESARPVGTSSPHFSCTLLA